MTMTKLRTPSTHDQTAPLLGAAAVWEAWEEVARQTLVKAMRERRVGYKALARELERLGIFESPGQLNRKVNRKKFSAAFMLVCMKALEAIELPPAPRTK